MLTRLTLHRRVVLGGCALTVAAYLAAAAFLLSDLTIAVWIVNITTLFYILVVRTLDKRYDRAFARTSLTMSCAPRLSGFRVADRGALTREDIRSAGLFPIRRDGRELVCGVSIEGRAEDIQIRACELTAYCEMAGEKRKLGLLTGLWMEARLPGDIGARLTLAQHGALDPDTAASFYAAQDLERLPLLEDALRDHFTLYADGAGAKMAARFAHRCVPLARQAAKAGCKLLLCLRGDAIHVFLLGRSLTFRTPIRGRTRRQLWGWTGFAQPPPCVPVPKAPPGLKAPRGFSPRGLSRSGSVPSVCVLPFSPRRIIMGTQFYGTPRPARGGRESGTWTWKRSAPCGTPCTAAPSAPARRRAPGRR